MQGTNLIIDRVDPSILDPAALKRRAVESALSGLALASRRAYEAHIISYLEWLSGTALTRESLRAWMRSLEVRGKSAQVRNQALAAIKRLACESDACGWIVHSEAAQIASIKSVKITGIRTGRWLSAAQVKALFAALDLTSLKGKRDAAVLALLIGCGLRRAEACNLETAQIKTHEQRMLLVNLRGKGGRIRSVSVPKWAALLLAEWVVVSGRLLRSITHNQQVGESLSPAAIRDIVRRHGALIGIPDLNPHDLRRTHAKLARLGGAPLEVIQHSLGHASLKTTELYTRTGEEANAGDFIVL